MCMVFQSLLHGCAPYELEIKEEAVREYDPIQEEKRRSQANQIRDVDNLGQRMTTIEGIVSELAASFDAFQGRMQDRMQQLMNEFMLSLVTKSNGPPNNVIQGTDHAPIDDIFGVLNDSKAKEAKKDPMDKNILSKGVEDGVLVESEVPDGKGIDVEDNVDTKEDNTGPQYLENEPVVALEDEQNMVLQTQVLGNSNGRGKDTTLDKQTTRKKSPMQ